MTRISWQKKKKYAQAIDRTWWKKETQLVGEIPVTFQTHKDGQDKPRNQAIE